jgi:hypothetical protein
MRDFQALSGFPSQPKRATIEPPQTGENLGLGYFLGLSFARFHRQAFDARARHWSGEV